MTDSSLATSQALDANSPETQPGVFAATTRDAEDRCDRALWSDMDARTTPCSRFALSRGRTSRLPVVRPEGESINAMAIRASIRPLQSYLCFCPLTGARHWLVLPAERCRNRPQRLRHKSSARRMTRKPGGR
jgi:hypothetical protein